MTRSRRPGRLGALAWAIDDVPTALRRKGSAGPTILLPETGPATLTVGSTSARRERGGWSISSRADAELRRDGVALPSFPLLPGVEVGIDRMTLIIESRRLRELTRLLGFLLGIQAWSTIDHALRVVRDAVCARRTLVLCGDQPEPLIDAARRLHQLTVGRGELVVCTESGGGPNRLASARTALARAGGGTVCVVDPVPRDFSQMLDQWSASSRRPQLILCLRELHPIDRCLADPIILVPLKDRPRDRRAIVDHFVAEASRRFEAQPDLIPAADRLQLANEGTLDMLEVATTRLVAVRHFGGVTRASVQLGVSHGAVVRYFARRGITP